MSNAKETITGPGGLTIELDSRQIFPNDPGQGTPAIVKLGRHDATFWCALNEGELDGGAVELTPAQCRFLENQEDKVAAFLEAHGG